MRKKVANDSNHYKEIGVEKPRAFFEVVENSAPDTCRNKQNVDYTVHIFIE